MKYKLDVYSLQELGQRSNQEDSMFPTLGQENNNDRVFILCDGMGGHDKGEVASQTVCETMGKTIMELCPDAEGHFDDDMLKQALSAALDALDLKDNGAEKKMGTTMTFLKLHAGGATIAHIGDSRVYHIRSGNTMEETKILFQTSDHSLVNDLVKSGNLTPEEAKTYPRKNVITRAMQPNMERRPKADIYHTADIMPGDYFMLCSDGILEEMEDETIKFIFSKQSEELISDADRIKFIKEQTEDNHDNHTAFVIHISDVEGVAVIQNTEENETPTNNLQDDTPIPHIANNNVGLQKEKKKGKPQKSNKKRLKSFLKEKKKDLFIGLAVALVLAAIVVVLNKMNVVPDKENTIENKIENATNKIPTKRKTNKKEESENTIEQITDEVANAEKEDASAQDMANAIKQQPVQQNNYVNNETNIPVAEEKTETNTATAVQNKK